MNKLIIRTGKVESIKRYHPWIFSGAVKNIEGEPKEGEWVEVYDNHNNLLAMAQYSAEGSTRYTCEIGKFSLTKLFAISKASFIGSNFSPRLLM